METQTERVRPTGSGTRLHALAGVLPDGTPHHVAVGVMLTEPNQVCCHLCGGWFRSVAAHLASHGWSRQRYVEAFGLEQGASLECELTRQRRAASFEPRRVFEPKVREGISAGHALARSGALAEHAAKAARGRPHSVQRRAKTLESLSRISPEARDEGTRIRRRRDLEDIAQRTATRFGFADVETFVLDRLDRGSSLAAISREAGLHKDWFQRHLGVVAPRIEARLADLRLRAADHRLSELVTLVGFADVAAFLRSRHLGERRSVHAIARELGVSRFSIEAAMGRHGIGRGST